MANDVFRQAEEQYYLLRAQLETGRITRPAYEEALNRLMVQDAQGRYWILGADSGKWFVSDGAKWVEALPPRGGTPVSNASGVPVPGATTDPTALAPTTQSTSTPETLVPPVPPGAAPRPMPSPTAPPPPLIPRQAPFVQPPIERRSRAPLLIAAGAIAIFLLVCLGGVFLVTNSAMFKIAFGPTNTPTLASFPGLAIPSVTTLPPGTSLLPLAPGTPPSATAPTPASPSTVLPAILWTPEPTVVSATLKPAATPTRRVNTPTRTRTTAPPATVAVKVPTVSLPPGVYVTDLKSDPSPVHDGQYPTFIIALANTTGSTAYYRVFVKLYEPDKRQSFGETSKVDTTLNPGPNVVSAPNNWKAVGTSPCRQFIARVFYESPDRIIIEFTTPGGDSYSYVFNVCQ